MESLKIDRTTLKTVENYARHWNMSKPTVYKKLKEGMLKKVIIDGVTFVQG
jgi:hypothetical protein